ncbi:MAG: hypothetical protein HYT88_04235 [Candidatus Omnitrophica bacterium]|nr:hypothetical protein [Candidatus Omnitrophota bacterium]
MRALKALRKTVLEIAENAGVDGLKRSTRTTGCATCALLWQQTLNDADICLTKTKSGHVGYGVCLVGVEIRQWLGDHPVPAKSAERFLQGTPQTSVAGEGWLGGGRLGFSFDGIFRVGDVYLYAVENIGGAQAPRAALSG